LTWTSRCSSFLRSTSTSCGIIRIEVLRGITDRRNGEWIEQLFDEMSDCPLDDALVKAAARLA
jgi:hypothetical protein